MVDRAKTLIPVLEETLHSLKGHPYITDIVISASPVRCRLRRATVTLLCGHLSWASNAGNSDFTFDGVAIRCSLDRRLRLQPMMFVPCAHCAQALEQVA